MNHEEHVVTLQPLPYAVGVREGEDRVHVLDVDEPELAGCKPLADGDLTDHFMGSARKRCALNVPREVPAPAVRVIEAAVLPEEGGDEGDRPNGLGARDTLVEADPYHEHGVAVLDEGVG